MRLTHITAAAFIAASVALSGCNSGTTTTTPDYTALIAEVVSAAQTTCKFIPTAETVAGIATAQSISATAGLAVAKSIADSICGAVTAKSAVPGKVPEVSGVKVEGHFVQ